MPTFTITIPTIITSTITAITTITVPTTS
jgi:hypothetical protein